LKPSIASDGLCGNMADFVGVHVYIFKKRMMEVKRMVAEAQGLAQKRILEGYTYQEEREFDVAERQFSVTQVKIK